MNIQDAHKKATGLNAKEGILKAIEGDWLWKPSETVNVYLHVSIADLILIHWDGENEMQKVYLRDAYLDPLYWKCLGKALGDGKAEDGADSVSTTIYRGSIMLSWQARQHRFVEYTHEGIN